jgi:hypothetical protein
MNLFKTSLVRIILSFFLLSPFVSGKDFKINKSYLSLTVGETYKLQIETNQKVSWTSSDTSIAKVIDGLIISKQVGRVKITVNAVNSNQEDSCEVSVVNWIAQQSKLEIKNIYDDVKLLGADGNYAYAVKATKTAWRKLYRFNSSSSKEEDIFEFPSVPDRMLITPFGYFVIIARKSPDQYSKIYKGDKNLKNWHLVAEYPLKSSDNLPNSIIMQEGWSFDNDGNMYIGEYCTEDSEFPKYQLKILKSSDYGESWKIAYTFPPRDNHAATGGIRHVHACQVDPYTNDVWIGTGDENYQSRIYYHTNKLLPDPDGVVRLNLVGVNSQEYRTVGFAFTKDYIYWAMDSPTEPQKIFRIKRRQNYPTITPSNDYRECVGLLKDKSIWYNYELNNLGIVLFQSSFEDASSFYNPNKFKEIDHNDRIYGVKEADDGNFQLQELLSVPAAVRYTHFTPMGQDINGNIYFRSFNIFEPNKWKCVQAVLDWNDVDCVQINKNVDNITFPNSKINFSFTPIKEGSVALTYSDSLPLKRSLPKQIYALSRFYFHMNISDAQFSKGKIGIPVANLTWLKNYEGIVWLWRENPDEDWTNIGGTISNGMLYSSVPFESGGEFSLGIPELKSVSQPDCKAEIFDNNLTLKWKFQAGNISGFIVEKKAEDFSDSNSKYSVIADLKGDVSSFTETLQDSAPAYSYRIRAYNAQDTSDYSKEVVVKKHPPINLEYFNVDVKSKSVKIRWRAPFKPV